MRLGIFQHHEEDPAGSLLLWLDQYGSQYGLKYNLLQINHFQFPSSVAEFDALVVLGGLPNVDEIERFPWLLEEKKWIRRFLGMNKPILGICLGGQLLAEALGGNVYKAEQWEKGWAQVQLEPEKAEGLFPATKKLNFFHWHEYVFSLPPMAQRTAFNPLTRNQAFVANKKWVGFQFHPEAMNNWIEEHEKGLGSLNKQRQMQAWFFEFLHNYFKSLTLGS